MDDGGSCDTHDYSTTIQIHKDSITCILFSKMPAMLFLLKKRMNL